MNNTDIEKYRQMKKEAFFTAVALLALIVFWLLAGFGLSGVEASVFGVPLWAVCSTVGVWFFAVVLVKILLKFVFRDMEL